MTRPTENLIGEAIWCVCREVQIPDREWPPITGKLAATCLQPKEYLRWISGMDRTDKVIKLVLLAMEYGTMAGIESCRPRIDEQAKMIDTLLKLTGGRQ